MAVPDKRAIIAAAVDALNEQLAELEDAARTTRSGVVHEESRAENDKDTRSLEASYLARGQAARVEETREIRDRLKFLSPREFGPDSEIGPGALVELTAEATGQMRWFFLVPVGGGTRVTVDGVDIQFITPSSPLGRALFDRFEGDDVTVSGKASMISRVM